VIKVDMLFRQQTNKAGVSGRGSRIGGWSEGWYWDGTIEDLPASLSFLCQKRAAMLTTAAQIVGQRIRVIGGGSSTNNLVFPGTQDIAGDLPQIALNCTAAAVNKPNVRHFQLRGIADARTTEGEYEPSTLMTSAFNAYKAALAVNQWCFLGRDLTKTKYKVLSISEAGVVVVEGVITIANNSFIRLLDAESIDGENISGRYYVATGVTSNTFTIPGWKGGESGIGTVRVDDSVVCRIDDTRTQLGRLTIHKVGRDFFQFVGRRSARR